MAKNILIVDDHPFLRMGVRSFLEKNIKEIEGCYITTYELKDVVEKADLALQFGKNTKGRDTLTELGFDSEIIANKLVEIYNILIKH